MERNILIDKLIHWNDLSTSSKPEFLHQNATMLADKILSCSQDIQTAIFDWLENGTISVVTYEGISQADLIDKANMKPIAAYLTLDWIRRGGEAAANEIRQKYSF